ncbi:hypothetical protein ACEWPL_019045 [Roseovarius sp. S1116L3]|uniref:hypothetical protein n=1 Tax=Roseovarius roseus TaxID=3342636 RepID=UPI003726381A
MRKIIDRKIYDMKTAISVATDADHDMNGWRWYEETLYRTNKGAWFLAGEGGPLSRYAVHFGRGESAAGEDIIPLSDEEAFEWLAQIEDFSAIETHFSDYIDDA